MVKEFSLVQSLRFSHHGLATITRHGWSVMEKQYLTLKEHREVCVFCILALPKPNNQEQQCKTLSIYRLQGKLRLLACQANQLSIDSSKN